MMLLLQRRQREREIARDRPIIDVYGNGGTFCGDS